MSSCEMSIFTYIKIWNNNYSGKILNVAVKKAILIMNMLQF